MPYANNNGVKIHYEVDGKGPPLILHHGFSGTWEKWRQDGYAQELSKDYRLIMLDARGHGSSDKPHDERAYDFKFTVGDLVAILDDLKIQRANFLGYSMGGRIGFRIPIYAPERFSSLILGGAAYPILGTEDAGDDILIGHRQDLEKGFKEAPDRPIEIYVAEREKRRGLLSPSRRASLLANDPIALLASISAALGATSPNWDKVLPQVTVPCLLFVGEADPRFPKVKETAKLIPNATFFSLPGLDHWQGSARSDLTLPHIKKFLVESNSHKE